MVSRLPSRDPKSRQQKEHFSSIKNEYTSIILNLYFSSQTLAEKLCVIKKKTKQCLLALCLLLHLMLYTVELPHLVVDKLQTRVMCPPPGLMGVLQQQKLRHSSYESLGNAKMVFKAFWPREMLLLIRSLGKFKIFKCFFVCFKPEAVHMCFFKYSNCLNSQENSQVAVYWRQKAGDRSTFLLFPGGDRWKQLWLKAAASSRAVGAVQPHPSLHR